MRAAVHINSPKHRTRSHEEFPSGILAGMELAGKPITTEHSSYREAAWATIQAALRESTLAGRRNAADLALLSLEERNRS